MKKYIISAVIISVFSLTAAAQASLFENTNNGVKVSGNGNLRFTNVHATDTAVVNKLKTFTEVNIGAHYSYAGSVNAFGVDLSVAKVYVKKPAFSWLVGGLGSLDYAGHYGLTADMFLQGGFRVGRKAYFELTPMVGLGQLPYYDLSRSTTNAANYNEYYNSVWRLKIAPQVALGVKVSDHVSLRAFARYTYAITGTGDRSYQEAEGWKHEPTEYANGKLTVGASVAIMVDGYHQTSGDNCWNGGLYSGYSFKGNEGVIVGGEIFHFKRTSAKIGRIFGAGVEQTIKSGEKSFSSVFGKAGIQYLPKGADSPVIFETGLKVGLGEYRKGEAAATSEGTYYLNGSSQVLGVTAKAYGSVNFHWKRNTIKVGVEGGGHTVFGTNFEDVEGSAVHFDGSTSKKGGADMGVTLGYTLAF